MSTRDGWEPEALQAALDARWREGWTPADLLHVVGRRLEPAHVAHLARAVLANGSRRARTGQALHPRWTAQLDAIAERHGRAAASLEPRVAQVVLAMVQLLGPIPPTMPPPGARWGTTPGRGLDDRVLHRVRALLAKAESTEFEHEAEALTAKAQELIARHAIDEALLETPDAVGEPSVRRVHVDDPYADGKAHLIAAIASANRCRAVLDADAGWVTVFGYDSALDAVELLGASLLAQATAAMARHGPQRDAAGRSRTRAFRRAFLFGFAARIGQRLRETTEASVAEAGAAHGGLLPVLAARDERVEQALATAFPRLVTQRATVSHAGGWTAGQVAADQADLDVASGALRRPDA